MNLLNTIKIPRGNIRQLNSQLPKKNYDKTPEDVKEEEEDDEDLTRDPQPSPNFEPLVKA